MIAGAWTFGWEALLALWSLTLAPVTFVLVLTTRRVARAGLPGLRKAVAAMGAREVTTGKKVVLPIWHNVGHDQVATYSAPLANKVAARTEDSIDAVAEPRSS